MINIGICDDDTSVGWKLEEAILNFQSQTTEQLNTEVFFSGEELVDNIKNGVSFDLLFLDIELGSVNGIDIGHMLRDEMEDHITKIIYITSKNGYEKQLFDVQPFHFLSKPLESAKVHKDLSLVIKILGKDNDIYTFKIGYETHRISIKEILYFECDRRLVKLVSLKETFHFYAKINAIEQSLAKYRFMRPHRSYLINYNHITKIRASEINMSNGDIIYISRDKIKEIRELLAKFEEDERN